MPKSSTVYICQQCSYQSPKWLGQCPECSTWNSFEETLSAPVVSGKKGSGGLPHDVVVPFHSLRQTSTNFKRLSTGFEECDRVLGGGMVPGAVMLIGGEPGIGKSTLLTHIVINILSNQSKAFRILYICGEESPQQIALRVSRMTGSDGKKTSTWKGSEGLIFLATSQLESCEAAISQEKPDLVIVDSIQSMQTDMLTGTSGSVGQLKECTQRLTTLAKALQIPMFLVGHVTKEGAIAGPKVLEHIVDTVLELQGERTGFFRILRTVKNRFGATDEVGIFQMVEGGLEEVTNPSKVFLEEMDRSTPGSAIVPVMEGTRVILLEIQALVIDSQLAMPRRVGRGVSLPRIQLLAAVLQKHCGLSLGTMDIFVNVAGGVTIEEPAADLAIAMAIASSCKNVPLSPQVAYAGELGLLGEVRKVGMIEKRTKEAKRHGVTRVISRLDSRYVRELVRNIGQHRPSTTSRGKLLA